MYVTRGWTLLAYKDIKTNTLPRYPSLPYHLVATSGFASLEVGLYAIPAIVE